jgi:hypothetical protein
MTRHLSAVSRLETEIAPINHYALMNDVTDQPNESAWAALVGMPSATSADL